MEENVNRKWCSFHTPRGLRLPCWRTNLFTKHFFCLVLLGEVFFFSSFYNSYNMQDNYFYCVNLRSSYIGSPSAGHLSSCLVMFVIIPLISFNELWIYFLFLTSPLFFNVSSGSKLAGIAFSKSRAGSRSILSRSMLSLMPYIKNVFYKPVCKLSELTFICFLAQFCSIFVESLALFLFAF